MVQRIMGIDTGGTMAKAALFELDGREIASERRANRLIFPAPGHTEIDAEALWQAACEAIRGVLDKSGTDPADIIGISTTGHGNGLYAVDGKGLPVMPGIVSTDGRAAGVGIEWSRRGFDALVEPVIRQRFWPGQTLALLGWFTAHCPDAFAKAAALFGSKDYLRARLTGDLSTDITEAAVSGLAALSTGGYATGVFETLGFGGIVSRLPPIRPSAAAAGHVNAAAASQTGLLEGTPVIRGVTDVVACALGSGVASPRHMAIVAGTFSVNETLHAAPRRSFAPMLQMPYPIGGLFIASECSATSASNLEWICRTLLRAEAERAREQGRSIYSLCSDLAAEALERPDSGVFFFPFLFGGPDGAPAGFAGLKASHDLADVIRAVFEGVAFAHRLDIDRLRRGEDAARPTVGRLAGGAARSLVWPQIFADVLGLRIEVPAGEELGAKGAAMCVATALGHYDSLENAMAGMVRIDRSYEPNAARQAACDAKFSRFSSLMTNMSAALEQSTVGIRPCLS